MGGWVGEEGRKGAGFSSCLFSVYNINGSRMYVCMYVYICRNLSELFHNLIFFVFGDGGGRAEYRDPSSPQGQPVGGQQPILWLGTVKWSQVIAKA